ncbi:hypothetical protein Alches_27590 [Alicyclobacillus hesperidum subsp. aegles]|uniref:phasin family protein n=1 Tax=Alicyclobacillus hesperidum TaxID=89784 RepID=UPI000A5EEF59|nr:hypothetical protein [Alicyclobacillus hesperidum]GLG02718.1 hypothetical protein Alches_27590 [Alicyclobacillus hesperidum subsp. aegles]
MLEDSFKKVLDLGVGLMSYSRERLSEAAKQWAEEKRMTPQQTRDFVHEMIERGEQGRIELQNAVQDNVQKALTKLGVREDQEGIRAELASLRQLLERLDTRVQQLEAKLSGNGVADTASAADKLEHVD